MRVRSNIFVKCLIFIFSVVLYCEFFIYYVVLSQCDWPILIGIHSEIEKPVNALFLADTHLLGKRNGHWFDKLRREWQMYRAFQSAMTLHRPEVVFVLGDLFDEGLWCSGIEFNNYIDRFHSLFSTPDDTKIYVAVGNHDIGFHYMITPYLAERFASRMNSPAVQMVTIRGNHFAVINSMAMEGDGCFLCHEAELALNNITAVLRCMKGTGSCQNWKGLDRYSRPILLQHFPLYRVSDEMCTESDAAPLPQRNVRFRERWECLSRESTEYIVDKLEPRVVLGGHTHNACFITHTIGTPGVNSKKMIEYSVPSFSWRNRNDPSFMLGVFSPDNYKISKCHMPKENTVIIIYGVSAIILILYLGLHFKGRRYISSALHKNY